MKINIKQIGKAYHLEAKNEIGNSVMIDASEDIGGEGKGMRPTQLLLSALGSCSAIDVILILNKQKQQIDSLEIEVDGRSEKVEDYSLFKEITLHFKVKGEVDYSKIDRAIKLSLDKYCSIAKTLAHTAKIHYKISLNSHV